MRRYLVENYLHAYLNNSIDEDVAKKGMLSRMNMKHGSSFLLDVFEAMRQRKGKWPNPNTGSGCVFHDHEGGEVCEE